MKKRLVSLMLVSALIFSLAACGSDKGGKKGNAANGTQNGADGPARVTSPITINFWHTFGSGKTAEYMADVVSRFNETNEYGITVNATYIGSYATVRQQLTTSIGAGDNPQVAVLGMSDILASADVLVDMKPYAQRDDIKLEEYQEGVQKSMYYEDKLTAMPFLRSATMFYYNVDMFKAAGYNNPPSSIDEMVKMCKDVAKKNNNFGFEMLIDMAFYQEGLIRSLGAEGLVDKDKKGAGCLEDGTFLKMLSDWSSWCEEGWCAAPSVTDATNSMYQMLYSGKIASCLASSAVISTLVEYGKESGVNIAAAPMPTYNGTGGCGGGGNVSIIAANSNEQQIAASWEFVKFLMSDEEQAVRSKATGYLPTTAGSIALMEEVFEQDSNMRAAYEARQKVEDYVDSIEGSEWLVQTSTAVSYVIQDKSMTPKEAVDYLKDMLPTVFY